MSIVLVVDDSLAMRKIVKRAVKDCKYIVDEFLEAGDGKQALEIVVNNPVDLVLIDWNMPVMTGIDFVKSVRSLGLPKKVPIIMITTETSATRLADAVTSGANYVLSKPLDKEQLSSALGEFLVLE